MNAREIILQDYVAKNNNEDSPLLKNNNLARKIHFFNKQRLFHFLLGIPITSFYWWSKRHTGRVVFRNLFFINLLFAFTLQISCTNFMLKAMKEWEITDTTDHAKFTELLYFYKNALLDI